MKRNLLAIAIPALLVAGAANASIEVWNKDGNKVDLYGRVQALNYIGNSKNTVDGDGDKTNARIGFTGETQITDSISGYGKFEWETYTGKDAKNETRYAFAGLSFGQYGSFDYGRNDGVLKGINSYTDVTPEFGGTANNNDYYVLSDRTNAVATYRNNGFYGLVDGLDFALQYGDNRNIKATGDNNGGHEAYGLNAQYAILDSGVTVGAGYAQTSTEEKSKAYNVGVKYDANNLYLAGLYIAGNQKSALAGEGSDLAEAIEASLPSDANKAKLKGFELVAQYGIDFEVGRLTPTLAYVQHKVTNAISDDKHGKYLAKFVEVGATYDFNKNISAVVDYKINLLKEKDIGAFTKNANTKDTLALALIYQF